MALLATERNVEALGLESKQNVLYLQQCFKLDKDHIYQIVKFNNDAYSENSTSRVVFLQPFPAYFLLFLQQISS
jgi:hypothetical protein